MARNHPGHGPTRGDAGFSLVEIVIVLLVAVVLVDIAAGGFAEARQAASVESAEYSFRALQARARAHAIERGTIARLELDTDRNLARLIVEADTLENLDFRDSYGVNVTTTASSSSLVQCMTSRGIADGACTSFNSPAQISFAQGSKVRSIVVLPLGQVLD